MTNFEKVGLFMKTFGQEVKIKAGLRARQEEISNIYQRLVNWLEIADIMVKHSISLTEAF